MPTQTISPPREIQRCISDCMTCHRVCLETIPHALSMGGVHAHPDHIRMLMDCAQICQTSADFMIRGSPLHQRTCGVCAEICDQCANECERIGHDEQMRMCAEVCRRCAEICHQMSTWRGPSRFESYVPVRPYEMAARWP